ncbi:hypothetical protein U1E44_03935 [Arenibacter sp. GZD96]|uniref:hypothetical protein n=1 Tax=Aurantibrevibacter litoralis TaxID=3106030 RepID=UPI002AFFBD83|nr:hypothetical protein [Arenibacter sp. GZD-96]MEA1785230.1 hypothetical protein [Arenibacter sp. GZD-96]
MKNINPLSKITLFKLICKNIRFIIIPFIVSGGILSCSSDNEVPDTIAPDPLADFKLVTTIDSEAHAIEVYSENQNFTVGYNELYVRVKDVTQGTYLAQSQITWQPMMHMMQMNHSCPYSDLAITEVETISKGYIVFQMPGNTDEFWDLTVNYTVNGQEYSASKVINVMLPVDEKQKVSVFMGADETRYVLAMTGPKAPQIAVNDITALLFKMENMMHFPVVENYTITLDPRMPGMGNHSSPNNVDLSYDAKTQGYAGKLALTMTGYWKLNLTVVNEAGELLKGEVLTEDHLESSLFFEIEF